jgi:hypothetical protein
MRQGKQGGCSGIQTAVTEFWGKGTRFVERANGREDRKWKMEDGKWKRWLVGNGVKVEVEK